MMRLKMIDKNWLVAAMAATFGLTALAASPANAGPRHWFYDDYRYYDDRAYYDDDIYDDDDVIYDRDPYYSERQYRKRRYIERRKRQLRRWAKRQQRLKRRRLERRAYRQRLYDAWQNEGPAPRVYAPGKRKPTVRRKPRRLAYVPVPRVKPYHKIPPHLAAKTSKVKTINVVKAPKTTTFDSRPNLNASAENKVPSKPVAPTKTATKRQKTKAPVSDIKPIRIKIVKAKPKRPATLSRAQQRLAENQLSCDKAKTIVSDFGFSDVTPRACTGTIYDFSAKRDGKPYSVKVSALSGELKGVRKIK